MKLAIHTGTPGTVSHIAGCALADMLSKKHPWLRAVVVETGQSADAVKTVARDPNLRRTGIFSVNSTIHNDIVTGQGRFSSPIQYQLLALIRADAMALVTIDPSIKTMDDLNGKKVSVGTKGGPGPVFEALLNAHAIKPAGTEYLSWAPACDAMIAGTIDAAAQTLGDTTLDPYIPPAAIKQLQAQKALRVIAIDRALIQKVSEATPIGYLHIAAKLFGAPMAAVANQTSWGVCPEFDAEVAYEIVKFMAENASSFRDYDDSLACIRRANLASLPVPTVMLHPAADKYYRESGTKIGL